MAFGSFESGPSAQPMSEINTTPLVDVMLVLLVIFIITAPLFHQAVPVDLPQVDSSKIEDPPRVIQLAIDAAGAVYLDGQPLGEEPLEARFRTIAAAAKPAPELHLRADRGTRYERVTQVMAAAQKAGIIRIAFVTEPAPAR